MSHVFSLFDIWLRLHLACNHRIEINQIFNLQFVKSLIISNQISLKSFILSKFDTPHLHLEKNPLPQSRSNFLTCFWNYFKLKLIKKLFYYLENIKVNSINKPKTIERFQVKDKEKIGFLALRQWKSLNFHIRSKIVQSTQGIYRNIEI